MKIKCGSESRRSVVKNHATINGIDYLEVRTLQNTDNSYPNPLLFIHCFKDITTTTAPLNKENIIITGGVRIKNIEAKWAYIAKDFTLDFINDHPGLVNSNELELIADINPPEKTLVVRSNNRGDFSNYNLSLVKAREDPYIPAAGFDLQLSRVEFSFAVECPREIDCACHGDHSDTLPEPAIDYMAKDYASFRKLILDRLSLLIPDWKERNPADFGMAMVELLAYVGDHLSYYQDAVATEAYLGTARSRISATRHARLLDYPINNGHNARAWVCFEVNHDNLNLQKGTPLLTKTEYAAGMLSKEAHIEDEIIKGAEVFETMYDVTFFKSKNKIAFYTWTETNCWLLVGATSTTIKNDLAKLNVFVWERIPEGTNVPSNETDKLVTYLKQNFGLNWLEMANVTKSRDTITFSDGNNTIRIVRGENNVILWRNEQLIYEFDILTDSGEHLVSASCLGVGDVLIFKEGMIDDNKEGHYTDGRCHAVRLTLITTSTDLLTGQSVLELEWGIEDALPFSICIAKDGSPASIIYGNVVLADHGYTTTQDLENRVVAGKYYPKLSFKPLTYCGPDFDTKFSEGNLSAISAFNYEIKQVRPAIHLEDNNSHTWIPALDLLSTSEFDHEFVTESENDGTTYLRFNDIHMRNWASKIYLGEFRKFKATFRIGNGTRGHVGPGSISRIFVKEGDLPPKGIDRLSNPMPANGGQDQETIETIRQFAPQAFRKQERAVTPEDYEQVLKRHPEVYRAVAEKRWTGSWYTMFVAIDRKGSLEVDDEFKKEIVDFFDKYRLAGYDVEIQRPIYVPIEIDLEICLKKGYFIGEVKQELLRTFSSNILENGPKGFFHADNFTFGQPLYLSKIYKFAMAIDGISSVVVKTFKRWGRTPSGELDEGVIKTGNQEIVRLDNDPNFSENGVINFIFYCGGENKEA
jgi:hypothetical protein